MTAEGQRGIDASQSYSRGLQHELNAVRDVEERGLECKREGQERAGTRSTVPRNNAQTPLSLQPARSRPSATLQRSHMPDGYGQHGKDEGVNEQGVSSPGKDFEVQFHGDDDPYNPKNKPELRKWLIVLILAASSLNVTCARWVTTSVVDYHLVTYSHSAMYTSTYRQLEQEFHVSRLVATLGLTTYVCGLGLGPMFLSPLSEFYGRRKVYICAFGMYFVWLIPCAVANNIATMLVSRFLDGLAGSAFLSVAGGTVGDMFAKDKLSAPVCRELRRCWTIDTDDPGSDDGLYCESVFGT